MKRKEIIKRVKKILLKHEENTSEGAIYWNFEWVGGKEIPTGRGGYIQEGGECVSSDKAFYEEMADFISQELDKAREEGKGRKLQGWECPKCGSVYSPLTFECPTCKNSGIKVRTSDRTSGYDNTSYLN